VTLNHDQKEETMGSLGSKRFEEPDETRSYELGHVDVVHLVSATAAKGTMEPGWRWSTSIKPIAGTESCQGHHIGYVLSGRLHVVAEGGDEMDVGPGDAYEILPGHDAWVVGDETYSALEFQSQTAETYAKK
jgi:mannose-6-phosphate isomerase-like protein (cupin superfamily)